jgi:GPH family glycoside/pentoside/hexuronide:cation symporter
MVGSHANLAAIRHGVMESATRTRGGLPLQLCYATGGGVEGVVYAAINNFLLFYMTVIAGLPPSLAGVAMLISLVVDGVSDPAIGFFSDNSRSARGNRHPFMLAAIIPLSLAIGLLFSLPVGLQLSHLFVYALAANIVMRVALAVYAIPYSALGVELWSDYQVRSRISVYRNLFFSLAHVALLGLGFGVFFDSQAGVSEASAYPAFGWTAAGLTFAFGIFAWATTRKQFVARPRTTIVFSVRNFVFELIDVIRSPSFRFILLGCLATWTATNLMFGLNLFALKFSWGMSPDAIRLATLAFPVGFFLGVPIAHFATALTEKRTGIVASIGCLALLLAALAILGASGWVPLHSPIMSFVLVGSLGVIGVTSMVFSVCLYAMVGDAVDEHDLLFGKRKEGAFYAAIVLGAKVAAGLGAMLAGFSLDLVGGTQSLTEVTTSSSGRAGHQILLLWGLAPAAIYLVAAFLFANYRISRASHSQIVEQLERRRMGSGDSVAPRP